MGGVTIAPADDPPSQELDPSSSSQAENQPDNVTVIESELLANEEVVSEPPSVELAATAEAPVTPSASLPLRATSWILKQAFAVFTGGTAKREESSSSGEADLETGDFPLLAPDLKSTPSSETEDVGHESCAAESDGASIPPEAGEANLEAENVAFSGDANAAGPSVQPAANLPDTAPVLDKVASPRETRSTPKKKMAITREPAELRDTILYVVLPKGVARKYGGFRFDVYATGPLLTDDSGEPFTVPLGPAKHDPTVFLSETVWVAKGVQESKPFNLVIRRTRTGIITKAFSNAEEEVVSQRGFRLQPGRHQFCFADEGTALKRHLAGQQVPTKPDAVLAFVDLLLRTEQGSAGALDELLAQIFHAPWFDPTAARFIARELVSFYGLYVGTRACAPLCAAACACVSRFTQSQHQARPPRTSQPLITAADRELGRRLLSMLGSAADAELPPRARSALRAATVLLVRITAPTSDWLLHLEALFKLDGDLAFLAEVREGPCAEGGAFCEGVRAAAPFLEDCPAHVFLAVATAAIAAAPCSAALSEILQLARREAVRTHVGQRLVALLPDPGATKLDSAFLALCEQLAPNTGLAKALRGHVIRLVKGPHAWPTQTLGTLADLVFSKRLALFESRALAEELLRVVTQAPLKELLCLVPGLVSSALADEAGSGSAGGIGAGTKNGTGQRTGAAGPSGTGSSITLKGGASGGVPAVETACLAYVSHLRDSRPETPLTAFTRVENLTDQVSRPREGRWSALVTSLYERAAQLASGFTPVEVLRCVGPAFERGQAETAGALYGVATNVVGSFAGSLDQAAEAVWLLTSPDVSGSDRMVSSHSAQLINHLLDLLAPASRDIATDAAAFCAPLWSLCASLSGNDCGVVRAHARVGEAEAAFRSAAAAIADESILVRELRDLLAVPEERVAVAFTAFDCDFSGQKISSLRAALVSYERRLESVGASLRTFFEPLHPADISTYQDDVATKTGVYTAGTLPLSTINSDVDWALHRPVLDSLPLLNPLVTSRTFPNLLDPAALGAGADLTVSKAAQETLPQAIGVFEERWRAYFQGGIPTLTQARELWRGVSEAEVVPEFQRAAARSGWRGNIEALEIGPATVRVFLRASELRKFAVELLETAELFELKDDPISETARRCEQVFVADESNLTLGAVAGALYQLNDIAEQLVDEPEVREALGELSRARALVAFLREAAQEDLRFMIDAVEVHSGEMIRETTVSDLIEVGGGLLRSLLENSSGETLDAFLLELRSLLRAGGGSKLVAKLQVCVENAWGLQRLFKNVANRGEMTVETVEAMMAGGQLRVGVGSARGENGALSVTYPTKRSSSGQATCGEAEISDLRGRALLLVNAGTLTSGNSGNGRSPELLTGFIAAVDAAQRLAETATALERAGHFDFRGWAKRTPLAGPDVLEICGLLEKELSAWEAALASARDEFYELNFCGAHQLGPLWDLVAGQGDAQQQARTLLTWIQPDVDARALIGDTSRRGPSEARLRTLGAALQKLLRGRERPSRQFGAASQADGVAPETVLLGAVDSSDQVLPAVMGLYLSQGQLPQPSDILVCDSRTSWEEVHLLLRRCFQFSWGGSGSGSGSGNGSQNGTRGRPLFCIAFADQLDFESRARLAKELRRVTSPDDVAWRGAVGSRLAVIVSGGHERGAHSFGVPTQTLPMKLTSEALMPLLGATPGMPEVVVVTSERPGLGKTETIRQLALLKGGPLHCLPITGAACRVKIIDRLRAFNSSATAALHIDISTLDDPADVNKLLFELIVVGALTSASGGPFRSSFPSVYIELANDMHDDLYNSLPVCHWFIRQHLTWDLTRLHVSPDVSSPVQIVCTYLQALESGRVDREDFKFSPASANVVPLPAATCQGLLERHYARHEAAASFALLRAFVDVLATQLERLSKSVFFESWALKEMRAAAQVRTLLVRSLVDAARSFAVRAVPRPEAATPGVRAAERLAARVQGMIQWETSNHLLVVFQYHGSVTALYRVLALVPGDIQRLFNSQMPRQARLPDYQTMTPVELFKELEGVVRTKTGELNLRPYALTADNLLKMTLISMRVRARVPVVIMGETGCGKTSLISYLAQVAEVTYFLMNIHAGTSEEDILDFVGRCCAAAASGAEVWGLLDEVNTCEHLGMLSGLVCHRSLHGEPLPVNLTLLATCNPYRLRAAPIQPAAGLVNDRVRDEQSRLVYRVHELPEAMFDWTWDYGSLNPADERLYIAQMVSGLPGMSVPSALLVDLLSTSQQFTRTEDPNACVSLRDVDRWRKLQGWFLDSLANRPVPGRRNEGRSVFSAIGSVIRHVAGRPSSTELRSVILALAHCYYCRLPSDEQRSRYRAVICDVFQRHGAGIGEDDFAEILRGEQMDYLVRMALPPGTATNAALRENVFVTLVCILTRIPVFMIGKPGCSKSLCMQLINSNLRGPDSSDEFFRRFPQVYVVSYQGSESSTSEGIKKVFDKASAYKEHNNSEGSLNVLPVVLLDEVGLAEVSRHNPLKVLHSLLELPNAPPVEVAVVGISNWELDPAKMNRAIHLSRPEPTVPDLYETARSILEAYLEAPGDDLSRHFDAQLKALARAYHTYEAQQTRPHFHGLRDFYSLIKSLRGRVKSRLTSADVVSALARNFGGEPNGGGETVQSVFLRELGQLETGIGPKGPVELVRANLDDEQARHLMVITSGDAGLGILERFVGVPGAVKLFGSAYRDDQSDEYSYRVLSKIISCMEMGSTLILRGMEPIYGSLYDMLNQKYAIVGNKRHCRVALGAFSSPMCHVSPRFRCIVLIDERALAQCDPPFLNRFEKHHLTYQRVLTPELAAIVGQLREWVAGMAAAFAPDGARAPFAARDMFCGLHEDSLPSLVLNHSEGRPEDLLERCKRDLIRIATADGIVRSSDSVVSRADAAEARRWFSSYFEEQSHADLPAFLTAEMTNVAPDQPGVRSVVMTYSSVHADVHALLGSTFRVQVEHLSAFTAERHVAQQIDHFWASDATLLVIQGEAHADRAHIQLAKFLVDEQSHVAGHVATQKSVVIIIHLQGAARPGGDEFQGFSFLCGWQQAMVDCLEPSDLALRTLCGGTLVDLLQSPACPVATIARRQLYEAFLCIKYADTSASASHVRRMVAAVSAYEAFLGALCARALVCLRASADASTWQRRVACSQRALLTAPSLREALLRQVEKSVYEPLAMLLYGLEQNGALAGYFDASEEVQSTWLELIADEGVLKLPEMKPRGLECYTLLPRPPLKLPFSGLYCRTVNELRTVSGLTTGDSPVRQDELVIKLQTSVANSLPGALSRVIERNLHLYLLDFAALQTPQVDGFSPEEGRQAFCWLLEQSVGAVEHPVALHAAFWENETAILEQLQLVGACNRVLSFRDLRQKWDGEADTTPVSFSSFLVTVLGGALLPNEEVLARIGGLEPWLQASSRVLRASANGHTAELGVLRRSLGLLHNFVSSVALPFQSEATRDALTGLLVLSRTRLAEPETATEGLSGIRAVFARLIEADARLTDAVARFWALVLVAEPTLQNAVSFALWPGRFNGHIKPVVRRLFVEASAVGPALIQDLLGGFIPESLQELQTALQVARNASGDGDNEWEALVCDVMGDTCFEGLRPAVFHHEMVPRDSDTWQGTAIRRMIKLAANGFSTPPGPGGILQHLAAAAFWRALLGAFTSAAVLSIGTGGEGWAVDVENLDERMVEALGRALTRKVRGTRALRVFLLKSLSQRFPLSAVRQIIEQIVVRLPDNTASGPLSSMLASLPWADDKEAESVLGFNPFRPHNEAAAAVTDQVPAKLQLATGLNNEEDLRTFVRENARQVTTQLGLAYGVASYLYVRRAAGELSLLEQNQAAALCSAVQNRTGDLPQSFHLGMVALARNAFASQRDSLLFLSARKDSSAQHLATVCAHLAVILLPTPAVNTPLDLYAKRPAAAATHFFLGAAPDLEAVARNLLGAREALTRYRCQCGALFFVGECGQVNAVARCPDCGETLGTGYHQPGRNVQRLDNAPGRVAGDANGERPGYIQETPESISSLSHAVRGLSPVAYRIVHLLSHAALLVGSDLGLHTPGDLSSLVLGPNSPRNDATARDLVQRHVSNDWRLLRQQLACDDQQASAVLHSLISSLGEAITGTTNTRLSELPGALTAPGSAGTWETAFAAEFVRPVTEAARPQAVLGAMRGRGSPEANGNQRGVLEMEIEETPFAMTDEYRAEARPRLLRALRRPDFAHFQATFRLDQSNGDRFPLLRTFLEHEEQLSRIEDLLPLVEWSNLVISRFGSQVDRREAMESTIEEALGKTEDAPLARAAFDRFAAAWDAFGAEPLRWECHDLPPREPMTTAEQLALSCLEKREPGVFLCAMVYDLAQLQNAFLGAAAEAAAAGGCASLRHMQYELGPGGEGAGKLRGISVQEVQARHVIHYQRDDTLFERHSWCHPDFGRGQEVLYDFAGLEAELGAALVDGKAHILTDNIREFPYRLELFRHSTTLLADVALKISPQEALSSESTHALRATYTAGRDTAAVLGALGVALSMLNKTGGDSNQSLVEYAQQWLPGFAVRHFEEPSLGRSQLRHVVSLYEAVEDCFADVIMASSDGVYRVPLPPDVRTDVLNATDLGGGALSARVLADVLKRFAVRFLSTELCRPDVPAIDYLVHTECITWPKGALIDEGIHEGSDEGSSLEKAFPQSLLVGHVWAAMELLQERIQLNKQGRTTSGRASGRASSGQAEPWR